MEGEKPSPESWGQARRRPYPGCGDLPHDAQGIQCLLLFFLGGFSRFLALLAWDGQSLRLCSVLLLEEVESLTVFLGLVVCIQDRDISAGKVCSPWGSGACGRRGRKAPDTPCQGTRRSCPTPKSLCQDLSWGLPTACWDRLLGLGRQRAAGAPSLEPAAKPAVE